tara:strand:- start:671 stop:7159 length:6489 start_codon:yes stop_codon:yes gene_type:complete
MSFDYAAAKESGASDREIIDYLSQSRGFDVDGALAAGASESDIALHMSSMGKEDETTTLGAIGEAFKRVPGGFARGVTSTFTGAGQLIPGLDDEMLVEAQRRIDEGIRETLGYDPAYDESNVAAVGEAVGQIGSFLIPGLGAAKLANAGRAAKFAGVPSQFAGTAGVGKAGTAVTTAVASAQSLAQGAEERQQAEERGIDISTGQRLASKASDVAIGALETVGMPFRILKGFPKDWHKTPEGSTYMQRMINAAKNLETKRGVALTKSGLGAAGREGAQETLSSIARELSAKAIYDPDREIGESWADDFQVGAGAGGIFDLGFNLATGRFKRKAPDAPPEIKPATEEEKEQELQARAEEEAEAQKAAAAAREGAVPGLPGRFPNAYQIPLQELQDQYDPANPDAKDFRLLNIPNEETYRQVVQDRADADRQFRELGLDQGQLEADPDAIIDNLVEQNLITEAQGNTKKQEAALKRRTIPDTPPPEAGGPVIPMTQIESELAAIQEQTKAETDRIEAETKNLNSQLKEIEKDVGKAEERNVSLSADPERDDILLAAAKVGGINVREALSQGLDVPSLKGDRPLHRVKATVANRFRPGSRYYSLFEDEGGLSMDDLGERLADAGFYPERPDANQVLSDISDALNVFDKDIPSTRTYAATSNLGATLNNLRLQRDNLARDAATVQEENQKQINALRLNEVKRVQAAQQQEALRSQDEAAIQEATEVERSVAQQEQRLESGDPVTLEELQAQDAELGRIYDRIARTQQPGKRQQVNREAGKLAQNLRETLAGFGIADQVTTRLVEQVGNATFNADGDLIVEIDPDVLAQDAAEGRVVEGSFDPLTKVIQISLDRVKTKVEEGGLTYQEAVADILNHEVIHALRRLDLFTAKEFSLLERLSRKYIKPGTNMSYAAWASRTYKDRTPVEMQEEAIAEMLRDSLTDGVNIDGKVVKPSGKIRQLLNKVVNFFKGIVTTAAKSDADSFADLVNAIRTGEVGGRERGVVRTLRATEARRGEIEERGITEDVLGYVEGQEPTRRKPKRTRQRSQEIADRPVVQQKQQRAMDVDTEQTAPEDAPSPQRNQPMFSRQRQPAFRSDVGRSMARDDMASELERVGIERGYDLSFYDPADFADLSPEARRLIKALERDDFLGMDRLDDALLAIFEDPIDNFDISPSLRTAIGRYVNESSGFDMAENVTAPPQRRMPIDRSVDKQSRAESQPRAHDPVKVEEAVEENKRVIRENPTVISRNTVTASPDAQYVAQNPEAAAEPTQQQMYSRQQYEGETESGRKAVDDLTSNETPQTPIDTYNEVTDILPKGKIGKALLILREQFINKYSVLERYYAKNPELRDLEADSSAMAAVLFSDRAKGVLASAITKGVAVYRGGVTTVEDFFFRPLPDADADSDGYKPQTVGKQYKGLIEVMSLLYSKERGDMTRYAQAYAMVLRGEVLDADGKLTPVTPEKAAAVRAEIDALTDENGYNPVKEWHSVWQAYNAKTTEFLLDTGMLNAETAEKWKKSSYVPFYREAADPNQGKDARGVFGAANGASLTFRGEFKKYKGKDEGVNVGLIESISLNLSAAIELGMKNVAQQRIVRDMQSMGLAQETSATSSEAHVIKLKVDGQNRSFIIKDKMLFDSLQMIGSDSGLTTVQKVLGWPANKLRELITRDPGFMVANLMRDTLSAWATSGADFTPVIDSVRNLRGSVDALERAGVVGGYDYSNDPDDIGSFFEKEMKRRNKELSAFNLVGRAWDALGSATTASDSATRMAVYKDVLARTGNEAEALFQAMEVINFSRRGASPVFRTVTAAIPFLNARIQGLDVFYRAATGGYTANKELARSEAIAKMMMRGSLMAGLTLLYYALVSDNEQYQEQTEVTRDNNWIIPTVWGVPIKLPIPFEVGILFKTIPETVAAATVGDKSSPEVRDTAIRAITSTFEINPLGIQAFGPFLEAALNYNSFTGRKIVPYYMDQTVTDGLQDRYGASEVAKLVGQFANISPLKIDHVMYGYTGTIGSYILDTVDTIWRSETVQGDTKAKMPAMQPYEYPIIKRFFGSKEGGGLREDAYDLYREVLTVRSTVNKLKKEGRREELERYLVGRESLLALKGPVYNIKKAMDKVRKQRDRIQRQNIDPETKRAMLDQLDQRLNQQLQVVPRLKKYADLPLIPSTFL